MAFGQPHLELRSTGYYWRRRVPAHAEIRFIPGFFCFPLKTHVLREAAAVARRLTAISDICFYAEIDMSPDVMTNILMTYANLEVQASDRVRALTGPRSRQAAEAALAIEAASRTALRDAIFRCDKGPALNPIHATAQHLGITLDEEEEDFSILADKMMRLLIELSEERERRAKGHFGEAQPYLSMALTANSATCPPINNQPNQNVVAPEVEKNPNSQPVEFEEQQCEKPAIETLLIDDAKFDDDVIDQADGVTVKVLPDLKHVQGATTKTEPTILEIWDEWFVSESKGITYQNAYAIEDKGKGERFKKNADTTQATRKILQDTFPTQRVSDVSNQDWRNFNALLRKIPTNKGRSPRHASITIQKIIKEADAKQRRQMKSAKGKFSVGKLKGDQAEVALQEAKVARLAPRTLQRHQGNFSKALDHAVFSDRIPTNTYKPFVFSETIIDQFRKSNPDTKRQPWGDEFQEMLETEKWNSPGTQIDDGVYWAPLIARFSGLREEEILQLKPKDVRSDEGIPFFDIRKGTGQSVKSNNARRFVPIHSQLIELGFLELVKRQKSRGKIRIFDKVQRSKTKKQTFSATFTKKFTYYRKKQEIYEKNQDFHALRTTFNSKAVTRSIPDTARRYIMGHKNEDVGIINYLPEGFPLATLRALMEQEQLDLSMISRRFGKPNEAPSGPVLAVENGIELLPAKTA